MGKRRKNNNNKINDVKVVRDGVGVVKEASRSTAAEKIDIVKQDAGEHSQTPSEAEHTFYPLIKEKKAQLVPLLDSLQKLKDKLDSINQDMKEKTNKISGAKNNIRELGDDISKERSIMEGHIARLTDPYQLSLSGSEGDIQENLRATKKRARQVEGEGEAEIRRAKRARMTYDSLDVNPWDVDEMPLTLSDTRQINTYAVRIRQERSLDRARSDDNPLDPYHEARKQYRARYENAKKKLEMLIKSNNVPDSIKEDYDAVLFIKQERENLSYSSLEKNADLVFERSEAETKKSELLANVSETELHTLGTLLLTSDAAMLLAQKIDPDQLAKRGKEFLLSNNQELHRLGIDPASIVQLGKNILEMPSPIQQAGGASLSLSKRMQRLHIEDRALDHSDPHSASLHDDPEAMETETALLNVDTPSSPLDVHIRRLGMNPSVVESFGRDCLKQNLAELCTVDPTSALRLALQRLLRNPAALQQRADISSLRDLLRPENHEALKQLAFTPQALQERELDLRKLLAQPPGSLRASADGVTEDFVRDRTIHDLRLAPEVLQRIGLKNLGIKPDTIHLLEKEALHIDEGGLIHIGMENCNIPLSTLRRLGVYSLGMGEWNRYVARATGEYSNKMAVIGRRLQGIIKRAYTDLKRNQYVSGRIGIYIDDMQEISAFLSELDPMDQKRSNAVFKKSYDSAGNMREFIQSLPDWVEQFQGDIEREASMDIGRLSEVAQQLQNIHQQPSESSGERLLSQGWKVMGISEKALEDFGTELLEQYPSELVQSGINPAEVRRYGIDPSALQHVQRKLLEIDIREQTKMRQRSNQKDGQLFIKKEQRRFYQERSWREKLRLNAEESRHWGNIAQIGGEIRDASTPLERALKELYYSSPYAQLTEREAQAWERSQKPARRAGLMSSPYESSIMASAYEPLRKLFDSRKQAAEQIVEGAEQRREEIDATINRAREAKKVASDAFESTERQKGFRQKRDSLLEEQRESEEYLKERNKERDSINQDVVKVNKRIDVIKKEVENYITKINLRQERIIEKLSSQLSNAHNEYEAVKDPIVMLESQIQNCQEEISKKQDELEKIVVIEKNEHDAAVDVLMTQQQLGRAEDHINSAEKLFKEVENIVIFINRKYSLDKKVEKSIEYDHGENLSNKTLDYANNLIREMDAKLKPLKGEIDALDDQMLLLIGAKKSVGLLGYLIKNPPEPEKADEIQSIAVRHQTKAQEWLNFLMFYQKIRRAKIDYIIPQEQGKMNKKAGIREEITKLKEKMKYLREEMSAYNKKKESIERRIVECAKNIQEAKLKLKMMKEEAEMIAEEFSTPVEDL